MSVKELVSFDDAEFKAQLNNAKLTTSAELQTGQTFGPAVASQKEIDANMNVSEEFSLAPEVLSNTRVKTISIVDEKVSQEGALHRDHKPGQEI